MDAQRTAGFAGTVIRDSTREPISGAEVRVPSLSLSAFTDDRGEFRLSGIAPGLRDVVVRHVGYGPLRVKAEFVADETITREIILARLATLDTVKVAASAIIPSFEENRKIGLGHFITRAELEKQEVRRLSEILSSVQGVRIRQGIAARAWLYSARGPKSLDTRGKWIDQADAASGALQGLCYAQVYLNESLVYRGEPGEPLFDLNTISPAQIEAIEYYAGPARLPMRYSRSGSECGVLVIHIRRSP
jgi:hypothetical protein